ncbi:MAG: NADH-quinone oxidoreductase subunit C [Pyrinomonadaceae bacterium]
MEQGPEHPEQSSNPEPISEPQAAPSQMVAAFEHAHADCVSERVEAYGEITIIVPREKIIEACSAMKMEFQFDFLADICGADRGVEEEPRFEVNYHLFSTKHFRRLRLKVLLNEEDAHVPSVVTVWRTANWHERETFDLFGVIFDGHPDLRRILLPEDWQGYALRKDFPLRGYEPYSLK